MGTLIDADDWREGFKITTRLRPVAIVDDIEGTVQFRTGSFGGVPFYSKKYSIYADEYKSRYDDIRKAFYKRYAGPAKGTLFGLLVCEMDEEDEVDISGIKFGGPLV